MIRMKLNEWLLYKTIVKEMIVIRDHTSSISHLCKVLHEAPEVISAFLTNNNHIFEPHKHSNCVYYSIRKDHLISVQQDLLWTWIGEQEQAPEDGIYKVLVQGDGTEAYADTSEYNSDGWEIEDEFDFDDEVTVLAYSQEIEKPMPFMKPKKKLKPKKKPGIIFPDTKDTSEKKPYYKLLVHDSYDGLIEEVNHVNPVYICQGGVCIDAFPGDSSAFCQAMVLNPDID